MQRRAIAVHGVVQGVGFRPFVYNLATRLELTGFVKNRAGSVWIEIEGHAGALDRFLEELTTTPPPLARIDHVTSQPLPLLHEPGFRIDASDADSTGPIFVSPDIATCADCLAELFNLSDRRYRYPFLNCANCGPRLTIITGAPYDRSQTTMASLVMCPACQAEYDDPANRRFHAQPTCCPDCGPHLQLRDQNGKPVASPDPVADFALAVRSGQIGAMKGLGGYHLVCAASRGKVVAELRRRKHRDEKPFAIMVADVDAAEALCEVNPAEREVLQSPARPIVLLRKRGFLPSPQPLSPGGRGAFEYGVAEEVAPGNPYLGIMLPYTPLHHLLMQEMQGTALVMTSGNRSDEPIAYQDDDALQRLAGIADLFLTHNRPIRVRCDDSVTRWTAGAELPLRRSRGYAPQPIALHMSCGTSILAVGGQMKGTFALGRGRHAFVSHHLGDLDHFDAYRAFEKDITLYEGLFGIAPTVIAHDLHPDYASTRYAIARKAGDAEVQLIGVQHHDAHIASCMVEHGLQEPVIGLAFDGTGYGSDGAIWGGEVLVGEYTSFRRIAHLRYVGMPGADQAVREPWRMALSHLLDAGLSDEALRSRILPTAINAARKMLERGFNTPQTSSMGRLFDAAACLAGGRDRVSFEGQAAIEFEWLAQRDNDGGIYSFDLPETADGGWTIDTRPLIRDLVEDLKRRVDPARIARRFHMTLVEIMAAVCVRLRDTIGLNCVVLSGGVFMNALLVCETRARLERDGFRVYSHRLVPPNDGGISLGQLAIAAACLRANSHGLPSELRQPGS